MKDKKINALRNLEVDVDPVVWKSIEAELDRKPKRRVLYIFLIAAIAVSSVFYQLVRNNNKNKAEINSTLSSRSTELNKSQVFLNQKKSVTVSSNNSDRFESFEVLKQDNSNSTTGVELTSTKNSISVRNMKPVSEPVAFHSGEANDKNLLHDDLEYLDPFEFEPYDVSSADVFFTREQQIESKARRYSRLSVSFLGGFSFADYKTEYNTTPEGSYQTEGINHGYFAAKVHYDSSPRWAFSIGVSTQKIEVESKGANTLYYPPNETHPANYDLSSTFGSLTGDAALLNQIIFGHDTTFSLTFSGSSPDTTLTSEMKINESFSFVYFPAQVYYKFTVGKITPFVSAMMSAGFLSSNSIYINDSKLPFNYNETLSKFMSSAGVSAGAFVKLFGSWNLITEFQYEKHISSALSDRKEWKPSIFKIGAGINYRF